MTKHLKKLIYTIIALIALSGIVLIHELGHLSFAKLFKVPVLYLLLALDPTYLKQK